MHIKLIALDMDGTTLNKKHEVSTITKDAIEQALAKKVEVIISTGRTGVELKPIFDKFPNIRYFICGNGSKIYDREKNINVYQNMLPFKESSAIMQQLIKYDVVPEVYANERIYTDQYYYDHVDEYIEISYFTQSNSGGEYS
jgi:HAD superfamily hydrolase (TIGR01484 family)